MKSKQKKNKSKAKAKKKSANSNNRNSAEVKGLIPLNDRILVRPLDEEEANKTVSGIIIPDTVSKEKPEQGLVVAVGQGKWEDGKRMPLGVKKGDRIVFSKYGYDEVKFEGTEYYILREENILAIIR